MRIKVLTLLSILTLMLAVATPAAAAPEAADGSTWHTVARGETLFSIGRLYHVSPWSIASANRLLNPNLIYAGQRLYIPGETGQGPSHPQPQGCGSDYAVRPGDTLSRIGLRHGVSPQAIAAANGLPSMNLILVGQVLSIPCDSSEVAPYTTPPYLVGIVTTAVSLEGMSITESELFSLRERQLYPDSLDIFAFETGLSGDLSGVVRLALARPVSNQLEPKPLSVSATEPITWVLIAPAGESEGAVAWQDIELDQSSSGGVGALVIERDISELITFTQAPSPQDSLQALIAARDEWSGSDTGGLWVDFLLMEVTDEQGAKSWVLYAFAKPPGVPAGEDRAITFCCRWLGCGGAVGEWAKTCRFWGCAGVCD